MDCLTGFNVTLIISNVKKTGTKISCIPACYKIDLTLSSENIVGSADEIKPL